ncbi:DNA methylase [Clostridiales bacterium PH28_bin88]|nr:DNA methylase [Clostridiales bacterium PH28_bin88]
MQDSKIRTDVRLIEAGFPCHQVGAETQRERGASSALPPLYFLHVWWARRPLTPSRAAILGSLLPAGTDPDWFLRQLGIEKVQALVNGEPWILEDKLLDRIGQDASGREILEVDSVVARALQREQDTRKEHGKLIKEITVKTPPLEDHPVIQKWRELSKPLPEPLPSEGEILYVERVAADPVWFKGLMEIASSVGVRVPNLYGYSRAYIHQPEWRSREITVLDPTAGGGSIPFEALRLGHRVIANELNPVAAVILYATLDYPARYGLELKDDIEKWGQQLIDVLDNKLDAVFPRVFPLPQDERRVLEAHLRKCPDLIAEYDREDTTTYLYARQVTCPHCGGEAPLLNTCWLSKEGDKWGVRIVTDGRSKGGKVRFETYRVKGSRGPNGEDPDFATVSGGVGTCVHCRQAIPADEIKAQARGESPHGRWQDRLYCVAAVRYQPKLDRHGRPERYKSGERAGEIKTDKVRFFRPPNHRDLQALAEAEQRLQQRWPEWERQGFIPTESFPEGNDMRPVIHGMTRWCDMFTPRQLLGHLILVEEINRLKPDILRELGEERGRAVVTYLQFVIDKGLDYNSKQTRWEYTRGIVKGTFGRHDFSLKWTFGEMIFTGPNSGAAWGLSQVSDAYAGMAELMAPLQKKLQGAAPPVNIRCGTAAHLDLPDRLVDLVCIDPPYYNNVQYAELADYFYVWQRRTLHDLYPDLFRRRLTDKNDEAVANPARDGSAARAAKEYERLMGEIFAECRRVLKDDGIMTIMFTHKTQEAWEALTRSLIENGWTITSSMPVESESAASMHQKDMAAAASSIFLTCRKREVKDSTPATWTGFGGTGVAQRVREAVREGLKEFEPLQLNAVDEMVASYGRALRVLSEHWPVLDGDDPVSPIRAMNEASAVVAQHQVARLTQGRLQVDDLNPEAAMALTLFGIFGLAEFPYDEALNLSRSLSISLEGRAAGYTVNGRMIGINDESRGGRTGRSSAGDTGYHAPLVRRGSKLRLALPEERNKKRVENPQTEWDILHGLILAYREGDAPVARAYLAQHAQAREQVILDLLSVWAAEMADEKLRQEAGAILFGLK